MSYVALRKEVIDKLREVIDPEIGMNIVDVGLIYWVDIDDDNEVTVFMTLTTPGCPLTDYFLSEIETKLMDLDFIQDVRIEFVWTPKWDLIMMDEQAKQEMFNKMRG
jgi:metal-sulfur cluster biosynthetic enzyme